MTGPLDGLTVIEIAGIGPAPFAGMVLADLGADVVRVDRPGTSAVPGLPLGPRDDLQGRGKRSIAVDLKQPRGAALVRTLATRAAVLIEGFRPGVAERLGIGPAQVHAVNPKLVYGRMTGWGQDGPLAHTAGHDVTYLARTGVLHAIGPAQGAPVPPVNLLGDYGGGGMLLVAGVLAALWRAERTGAGQVVDAAIVDGAALLATQLYGLFHSGLWQDRRGANLLDGGAPYYGVYETADGRHVAVGPLESRFYAEFVRRVGLDPETAPAQLDVPSWPRLRELIAARIATRTRDEWASVFADGDGCVAPVLSLAEAPDDPHLRARGVFVDEYGVRQPAAAPRFSATPPGPPALPPPVPGEHTRAVLAEWDVPDAEELLADGVVAQA
ncbi:CaiB/BaiF CoA transferase family protein [Phytohabitans rumicis]|uniref:CoA transferase n=1 Tax=Phytohabitans rumicis TaxID=1076125 RepID=A0A6V8LEH8_9ACTN|nr:CaiB/BaiF CoA-transferase family protein [Phytohabitans rumicis]GFJ91065.1 CoA transferase [Phytohabitans rumicis]